MTMRLGRLPHDPAAVAAAPSLATHHYATMAPPERLIRSGVPFAPQLRNNDTLPVCTSVGLLNGAFGVEALNTSSGLAIADGVELPFYAGCVGCVPTPAAIGATDGAVLLDVLRRQSSLGFDIGAAAPLSADFAAIPATDRAGLANSMALLGIGYWGVDLFERDMDTPSDQPWDDDGSSAGAAIGGHCLVAWDYAGLGDMDIGRLATWGRFQTFTWRWVRARLREAYVLVWPQLQRADGTNWAGVDVDRLRADVARWVTSNGVV
jgi:hypothetical protein